MNCDDDDHKDEPPVCHSPPDEPRPSPPPPPPHDDHGADGRCKRLAVELNKQLHGLSKLKNKMTPGNGATQEPRHEPLNIPRIEPWVTISWGDSECDCIESDDTEIMYLTVCNPYSNLTLANVTIQEVRVVDANNKAVPTLPNGDPCIELIPD